jgi:integrase
MKISKVIKNGEARWRVNDPNGPNGKRQRKFFETKDAAEAYAKERSTDTKAYGVEFTTIPAKERAGIMYQLERLKGLGWTLAEAVDFVERHGKAFDIPKKTLTDVATEFLAVKATAGLRRRYLKTLRASINRFQLGRREKLISEITPAEIQEYISANGWVPSTMRSYLVDVRTLFAFAKKRKYVTEDISLAVDLPRVEEAPPGIVTPDQATAILNASIDHAPDILASLALILFGGLRRSEAEALEWNEISDEFVEVKAHKAKTRQRRLVPISPQLKAWLECARKLGSTLPTVNYADKLKLVLDKAKLRDEWTQNALRHSFASYHFAKFSNENETARRMGNSPQMVFQHYRELVKPGDAEKFFSILPPADAEARAKGARQRPARVLPSRDVKISAETMAEVFNAGALTRKEAVVALCKRAGVSVAGAYNALSLEGRFAPYLKEQNGKLTWQKEALAKVNA